MDQARKLNGKPASRIPQPNIPENTIKPSGHNSTRPNDALFINIIPDKDDTASWSDILRDYAKLNNMPWRTSKEPFPVEMANKNMMQELTLAIEMYNSSLPWIYRVFKKIIDFFIKIFYIYLLIQSMF